jgi:hypothetical protein
LQRSVVDRFGAFEEALSRIVLLDCAPPLLTQLLHQCGMIEQKDDLLRQRATVPRRYKDAILHRAHMFGNAATFVATTGFAQANDSVITMPNSSSSEGSTVKSASAIISTASLRAPANVT